MVMEIRWDLHIAHQDDKELFVGVAPIIEIDSVCSVPHLPDQASSSEASILLARWALDDNEGLKEWQRRPDVLRILAIKNFMDANEENMILNSIMLYIPENAKGVTIERDNGDATIIIDLKKFLQPRGNNLVDVEVTEDDEGKIFQDHRPVWIVDGQHRTRGMALSPRGANTKVPVIVLHAEPEGGVDLSTIAKIFTEINTLAEPLDPFQQSYLSYKFNITSGEKKQNYGVIDEAVDDQDREYRRANRLMYELAARLDSTDDGPFEAGVQLAEGRGPAQMARIKLKLWLQHTRSWYIGNGVYSDQNITIDEIYDEVNSYFQAWSDTVNHDDYTHMNGVDRWRANFGGNQSHLEQSDQLVRVCMVMLFPWAREIATLRGLDIDVDGFSELLEPIRGIDWWDDKLEQYFRKGGEPTAKWLRIWLQQAILHQEVRTVDEVDSGDRDLVHHGRALYAQPSEPELEVDRGAIDTIIELIWQHGNVFTTPTTKLINIDNEEIMLDDEWSFESNDPLIPNVGILIITMPNSEVDADGWKLQVQAANCSPAGYTFEYTPDDIR